MPQGRGWRISQARTVSSMVSSMRYARPGWRATPMEPGKIDAEEMLCEHS